MGWFRAACADRARSSAGRRWALFFAVGCCGLARSAAAKVWGPWERRALFGGEVSATSFGIADLGL
ncbi:MAG TPA: hypothetical protein PLW65_27985, partial [Pseudomonadota bacterium]|nr:hypothetical protein [Pseudomonadota bacterium]